MFKITHIKQENNQDFVLISSKENNTFAKICLSEGARVEELIFNTISVIRDPKKINYEESFASSILFPFTNRIKNGKYRHEDKEFSLKLNFQQEKNAIHGLVYNKQFTIINEKYNHHFGQVVLAYSQLKKENGFPFLYSIYITYTLEKDVLRIKIDVKNNGKNTFPFCIGWHPYFNTSNLSESYVTLNTDKKLLLDEHKIPVRLKKINPVYKEKIENKSFDDCYLLKENAVYLETPDYKVKLESSTQENYLQLYTPNDRNCIAVEPMSAPSNSFNNKIGLQYLNADEKYQLTWKLSFL